MSTSDRQLLQKSSWSWLSVFYMLGRLTPQHASIVLQTQRGTASTVGREKEAFSLAVSALAPEAQGGPVHQPQYTVT